jgi:hypothetical protein
MNLHRFLTLLSLLLTLCTSPTYAFQSRPVGESVRVKLDWQPVKETKLPNEERFYNQYFNGAFLDNDLLPFHQEMFVLPAGAGGLSARLNIIRVETVSDLRGIQDLAAISTEFQLETATVTQKKKNYGAVKVHPFRRTTTGNYERLVEFELSTTATPAVSSAKNARMMRRSSVFASGNWYRVAVVNNGVYRLSYSYLKSIGMDADNIDPRHIRVYGNGGGQLPYLNAATQYDDPEENAIYVAGETDGRFDGSDYVLFYGSSQTRWKYDSVTKQFQHANNQYCDTTYYFLTTDLGAGKRITQRNSSTVQPQVNVTSFNDYAFHETDQYNLLKSGREWYGERMDNINTSRSFSFSFPNHSSSDTVFLRASLLGRATNSTNHNSNSFTIKINGATLTAQGFADVGSSAQDNYAVPVTINKPIIGAGTSIEVTVFFSSTDPNAQGWINFLELTTRCGLSISGRSSQFHFRDINSAGIGTIANYTISGANSNQWLWDISTPNEIVQQQSTITGSTLNFAAAADIVREFILFTPTSTPEPIASGRISNQNLHGLSQADMFIVTHPNFLSQANQLAEFHRNRGLSVHVVTPREIYNEFSSAAQDVCAIRNMMKMFYDRSSSPSDMPRYLLLLGDASYDNKYRITDNTNYIPSYQSAGSLNNTQTYMSDDFFGLLDDSEGEWTSGEIVDMAVGRLPVKSAAEADAAVRKIVTYGGANLSGSSTAPNTPLGDWRNIIAFVGDDQDNNTHFKQADTLASRVSRTYPIYNIDKIYLDAYNQLSTPGGQRYPDAQRAIVDRIERGALLMTYIGHGGEVGWAHERILEMSDINGWTNFPRLSAFLTATCEFTRVDDPARTSAGEDVFLNPNGGGICLFTTSRLAFSSSNNNLCQRFFTHVFEPYEGRNPTIGEIFEQTKIDVFSDVYVRNFLLIGDPALPLAYPSLNVKTTAIDGSPVQIASDTLKALRKVTISGEVTDKYGNRMNNFSGILTPTIYDKWTTYYTLGNDQSVSNDPSYAQPFAAQRNVIYKGKVSVTNGAFNFSFVVPKDIQFSYGFGKLSYYAQNGTVDACGYDTSMVVGGFDANSAADDAGPQVRIFMNDEKFIRGSITDENPSLLAIVVDSSGINAVGSGIGHDMTATLDNDANKTFVLNDYFQNELNSYQQGRVLFPFQDLTAGPHTLTFKVWDVHNNSSEASTEFIVESSAELALDHVLNYPNPFTTSTTFMFEHNRPFSVLDAQVQIFTVSGKLVKTIQGKIFNEGFRSEELQWDGLDDYGDRIGKGVYLYKLKVRTQDGSSAEKFEKLVILR